MTLPIDMISDVVCPWCFIGKRRLEKAIALRPNIPVEVKFRPYFLNPWVPREGMSREAYLTAKFGSPERYYAIGQRTRLASDRDVERVEKEAESAKAAGIDGVPCFILGGAIAVQGAQAPDLLADAIDRAVHAYTNRQAAE